MFIKSIKASNFRSFDKLNLNLQPFNILIGANASGKSNFIQIFRFLRDVVEVGLENAISIQGGLEYLVNSNLGSSKLFTIEIILDYPSVELEILSRKAKKERIGISLFEGCYKLELQISENKYHFKVIEDKLTFKCLFHTYDRGRPKKAKGNNIGNGEIRFYSSNRKPKIEITSPVGVDIKTEDILETWYPLHAVRPRRLERKQLLIESPFVTYLGNEIQEVLENIAIYDFDPKLSKRVQAITGKIDLQEDGSNLSVVMGKILKNKKNEKIFYNLMSQMLPFVDKFKVDRIADTLLVKLREKFSGNLYFPAFFISDGTINLAALITALFFEENSCKIVEEPERNIHPYLISKVLDMMRDASQNTQIITTTHNPELVRHAKPEEILLVSRTERGFSTITRPIEKSEIKTFLENELGMDQLYVQNLLEM